MLKELESMNISCPSCEKKNCSKCDGGITISFTKLTPNEVIRVAIEGFFDDYEKDKKKGRKKKLTKK